MENTIEILAQAHTEGKIGSAAYENVKKWLGNEEYQEYHAHISALIEDGKFGEIEDNFYTIVPFGTGGRRGTCGVGPNRINTRTIGESAQGLASYIAEFGPEAKKRGVVIAYDTRTTSREFANFTAKVLTGNKVRTYLFEEFRATPELSFAVRTLETIAGVVISASHNPPSDNGFKVYWEDGGQIVAPHDRAIIEKVNGVSSLKLMELDEAEKQGLFSYVGNELDEQYIQAVLGLSLCPERDVELVYSPLHGTGQTSILPVLRRAGFDHIHLVEEQMAPDGNFPNVPDNFPNPEIPAASEMAMALARECDADFGLTSDPDADRLGVFCKHIDEDGQPKWSLLSGNQVGVLLTDFLLQTLKAQGKLPENGVIAKTMVTTDMVSVIAKEFGMLTVDDLLVGFKYIGEVIRHLPEDHTFLFGTEESLGYLRGTFVRDKDAATGALTLAEMAADLKARGQSLYERLQILYGKYGFFGETLENVYVPGAEGNAKVVRMMEGLRSQPPLQLAGKRVIEVIDRKKGVAIAPETGKTLREIEGAKGNVLVFVLSDDGHTRVTIRPSGTEPKIKYYGAIKEDASLEMSGQELETLKKEAMETLDSYVQSLIAEAEKRG
ncbi:phosphoglucomutase [candidate division KSB3 bacterium]|uniref:Phosphoglucomutase n=1 Tax=candidate division KSB3 bacterium TaxID=2044937 RepID=A0A2G6KIG6_9BACT|nr:MAG: phosphoglucomutase [candidate division KSB3 bacterium]